MRPVPKTNSERQEWLRKRTAGVGGSDAAVILGLSKWKTAFELYHEKLGLKSLEMTEPQRWGLALEPVIADEYAARTGRELGLPKEFLRSKEWPWMFANLDRVAADRIVECKSSRMGDGFGLTDSDDVPDYYLVQVQHQMLVSGHDLADLAALIGGSDFRVYSIPFNAELAHTIAQAEAAFWEMVKARTPPEPDWQHPSTLDAIKRIFPPTEGKALDIRDGGADLMALCDSYRAVGEAAKELEARRDEVKAQLIHAMDGATVMSLPDGTKVTRRITQRAASTRPAGEQEYWRVGPAKG